MKVPVLNFENKKVKQIELPACFNAVIRPDIIHKVFWASQKPQLYGSYILAGKQVSASGKQSHRRHKYKTLYGHGISRVPRKVMTRRGERFYWIGAFAPGTVKGRAAHPPKPIKRARKINKKEKQIALKSAITATSSRKILEEKYKKFKVKIDLPIVVESSVIEKSAKEISKFLLKLLNIQKEIKKIRAGKGKRRGRKYKKTKILLVTSVKEDVKKLKNFGFDIVKTNQLNITLLAPGGTPGRIIIWTEKAIGELGNKK